MWGAKLPLALYLRSLLLLRRKQISRLIHPEPANRMNAITSYLRHTIVAAVLLFVEKTNLPVEGSEDAAHAIALAIIGTLTWVIVKYAPELAKRIGILVIPIAASILLLPSCAESGYPLQGQISYRDPATGAKGGLVFEPGKAPRASVRIPIYDEYGTMIGISEISGPLAREISATK